MNAASTLDESATLKLCVVVVEHPVIAIATKQKTRVVLRLGIACTPGISYHMRSSSCRQCTVTGAWLKRITDSELMFRLRQRHSRHVYDDKVTVSAEKLIAAQSVRAAVTGATIAVIALNIVWAYTASASGRYFPWFAIVQGAGIGIAVRRSGRGLDWRFPFVAGIAAWIGAFTGNLFIALEFTATETGRIEGSWWQIVQDFLANTVTVIDVIYAFCAVAVAMFYSKRQLNRYEVLALRKHAEEKK
jgi:hypothetical protein